MVGAQAQGNTLRRILVIARTSASPSLTDSANPAARRVRVTGRVQGVGFRPFVYRLATELGLVGEVRNRTGEVEILVQGCASAIEAFVERLESRAPPLARPHVAGIEPVPALRTRAFRIAPSSTSDAPRIFVPPDYFACEECLDELRDPRDRRFQYPFINCTQCGPRYTLITGLPYDRESTTMAAFALCPDCRREYDDPRDRRFHAEPVACPLCGPQVRLAAAGRAPLQGTAAVERTIELLRSVAIVAVKGIGGYHLVCDARNERAVQELRERKRRPDKPLAVMFPLAGADGLANLRKYLRPDPAEAALLSSPARPIVLVRKAADCVLAASVAPGLNEVGAFLPYSPLHALLLDGFAAPLVATSGNVSGEPVLTAETEAETRLASVCDAFLHHDRPIARPADDSVCRVMARAARPIRMGRGLAPLELELDLPIDRPLLAVGGHLKTTIALAWDDRVVVSPHIGDMGTPRSQQVFEQVVTDLPRLYGVHPERVVCDAHPGYATTRWAKRCGLAVLEVQHHHAHASALAGEHEQRDELLVFAWDGVGLGADGTLWGGECFAGSPGGWHRVARLAPFRLPGGERAAREPWRSAVSLCWHAGCDWTGGPVDPLVRTAWERGINSPVTSAVGRLFDAAAAIVLGTTRTTFEGQGPMLLEAAAESATSAGVEMPIRTSDGGLLEIDWRPLLATLLDQRRSVAERADLVHRSLAGAILSLALHHRSSLGVRCIGLTGGVFQNRRLSEYAETLLTDHGFEVLLPVRVPCNDGGLSYGQVIEAIGRDVRTRDRSGVPAAD